MRYFLHSMSLWVIEYILFILSLDSGNISFRAMSREEYSLETDELSQGLHKTFITGRRLTALLPYVDSMKACSNKNDSVHARLFRRIGYLYYIQTDFIKALEYYGNT
jgi:hypothetical protein